MVLYSGFQAFDFRPCCPQFRHPTLTNLPLLYEGFLGVCQLSLQLNGRVC